jgi:hypothetical protein
MLLKRRMTLPQDGRLPELVGLYAACGTELRREFGDY